MALNDTEEVVLNGIAFGQTILVTHHLRVVNPALTAIEQAAIDQWQSAGQAAWLACNTPNYTLASVRARQVCGTVPLRAFTEEAVAAVGTRVFSPSVPSAPWLAGWTRERTALAGRSRQGRYWWPILDEGEFSQDTILAALVTLQTTYAAALMTSFGPAGTSIDFRLVVHSRKLASVPGTQCQDSSTLINSMVPQNKFATQKSRRQRP